jgi:hypothetical protein
MSSASANSSASKGRYSRLIRYGTDRNGYVTFAPEDTGQIDSELFDINYSTSRIRPWDERRRQAFATTGFWNGRGIRRLSELPKLALLVVRIFVTNERRPRGERRV